MVIDPYARTVTRLGQLVGDAADHASDADLLRRYTSTRDDLAFAALVRRHGPMVFGVCRRTLGHMQDAEDAFQATFFVFARRAHVVRPGEMSRWLYGVAVKVAGKARARRNRRAFAAADLDLHAAAADPEPMDWLPMLDAALAKLADRDRRPILLCDLMGQSRAAAAIELGIAEGTLSSRLARAREKLRAKLTRLGATLSVPALAATLADHATATVPASLIESTIVAGSNAAGARELAEGVIRTMFVAKLSKVFAFGLCLLGMTTAGIVWLPSLGAEQVVVQKATTKGSPDVKETPKDDTDLARLQGTWVVESTTNVQERGKFPGGSRFDTDAAFRSRTGSWKTLPMTFAGNQVDFAPFPGSTCRVRVDSGHETKLIDFTFSGGELRGGGRSSRQGIFLPSIYRLEGEKLHIVLGDEDLESRPESFDMADKKSPYAHVILRRPTDDERKTLERAEQNLLEGNWEAVVELIGSERKPAPRGIKLVVKGDRLRFDTPDGPLHAAFSINLGATPWQVDLTLTTDWGDVKKGSKVLGIFSRQGSRVDELRLTLCVAVATRPASFDAGGKKSPAYVFIREGVSPRNFDDLLPRPKIVPPASKSRVRELQLERVKALKTIANTQAEMMMVGIGKVHDAVHADEELAHAELELATTAEERTKILDALVKRLKEHETVALAKFGAGQIADAEQAKVKAARLKWEIELEKLKPGKQ